MIRRLINLAAVAALLLTTATCVLWSRSYRLSDKITWTRDCGQSSLRSAQGHVVFHLYQADRWAGAGEVCGLRYIRDAADPPTIELLGLLFLCSDPSVRLVHW